MKKISVSDPKDSLSADLTRARQREAATREILSVISQSRDDDRPVFDAILHRAADLCDAYAAALVLGKDGDTHQRMAAHYGVDPATIALYDRGEVSMNPDASFAARAILTGKVIHVEDMMDTEFYRQGVGLYVSIVRDSGIRTEMQVPLLTPLGGIGAFVIFRKDVRPYTPDEIALVETFAAQAVIAIENVRQFRELQTRLAREAASAEILAVISQSRDDDAPVFDAILRRAANLCDAFAAALILAKPGDTHQRMAAQYGVDPATVARYHRGEVSMDPDGSFGAQAIVTGKVVHVDDVLDTDYFRQGADLYVSVARDSGIRTEMLVPLLSPTGAIGTFVIFRREVRPFTPDQIALVETFAAQAVIAIENVRQFRELQTRLAREAATREILEVISQSRDDERPVFDVVLRKAAELCSASRASLDIISEDRTHAVLMAHWGDNIADLIPVGTTVWPMSSDLAPPTCMREGRIVHVHDMVDTDLYRSGDPIRVSAVDTEGIRTFLAVPLFSGGRTVGCIEVYRREVDPFSADEIALVETFAAQAVIAIENVRQFRELQTRLAREAATREILEVISQSRDDDRPVFDVVLRKAADLCGASMAGLNIISEDRSQAVMVAEWGDHVSDLLPVGETVWPMESDHAPSTCMREGRIVHVHDLADTDLYRSGDPIRVTAVDAEGIRTFLAVPLFSGGRTVSCISIYRREVKPFSADEITLVETFAAQAVIAIENVRQFKALEARLEREAATRNILRVISESPDDEQPTFEAILDSATRLCDTQYASIVLGRRGDASQRMVAHRAAIAETVAVYHEGKVLMDPEDSIGARAIVEGITIHVPDMADTDQYRAGHERFRMVVDRQGLRTNLFVPLLGPEGGIGCFILWKKEVASFTADQIALIETFASHAVIAIENVRQFRALQERLAREAATREILQVISQSRDDDAPVFDVIVSNAARLCDAPMAWLILCNDAQTELRLAGYFGLSRRQIEIGDTFEFEREVDTITNFGRSILEARTIQDDDLALAPTYLKGARDSRQLVDDEGIRTRLSIPLVSGGRGIGAIMLSRREVAPFTPDQIALVETFAAQAVIAIENVRQFRELQTRLAREAATREILSVISQSRDDERPVFDVVLRKSADLCGASMADLEIISEDRSHSVMVAHWGETLRQHVVGATAWPMESELANAIYMHKGRVVHVHDLADTDLYRSGDSNRVADVDGEGIRTFLAVPLFSGGETIGCIVLYRREVNPFGADQIALIETFAAQAVIAIENVRQFRELQTRLAREAALREILSAISKSTEDETLVFDTVLKNAVLVCGADQAALLLVNDARSHVRLAAQLGHIQKAFQIGNEFLIDQSMSVIETLRTAKMVHHTDYAETEQYKNRVAIAVSLVEYEGIRTRLVIPLVRGGIAIGTIALSRRVVRPFSDDEIALVETFAAQAVIAIENVRQFKALEALNAELGDRVQDQVGEIERMGRLKRFLPAAVADTVISSGSEKMLSSHRALLGVLFCDIRGFTAFCETAEPEETIEVLQTYHEEMGRLINAHGAGVDHRMGDGIMVLFNDPLPCDDPAGDAVRLAMAMRARMAELCVKWKRMGHKLGFGLGVSLGYATVGMVGFEGRFDYTASGTAINLASRLCDEAQDGEILISPRTRLAVEGDFTVESRGEISFKGIREPVEVFCVTGVVA